MLLRRIWVVLLCGLIAGGALFYTFTFRLFDRPLTNAKQEEFQQQISLPDNFTLAASVNSFETVKNTLQAARDNVNNGAYALELNVTFGKDDAPYLADGAEFLTPSSVPLETIFKEFQDSSYLRYVLRLQNQTQGSALMDLAAQYNVTGRIMLIGVSVDDLPKYAEQYASFLLCVQPDADDLSDADAFRSFVDICADYGVAGVSCGLYDVTDAFREILYENGQLRLVLDGVNSNYEMYYALSLNPNIVITEQPEALYEMMLSQDYLDLNKANAF